ncbi:hypothetical protein N9W21_01815 [Shewanella sp.]|nr:hypothetical protein [Shewanella sp.]
MLKSSLLLFTVATIAFSAHANATIASQLSNCAAKQDKLERLICYDNLAHSIGNQPVAAKRNPVHEPVKTAAEKVDEFGNLKKPSKEEKLDTIHLIVKQVSKDPYGALKITFENGQIWKQTGTRRFKLEPQQKVFIKTAALSSFMLGTAERNSTIRVKRIK